MKERYIFGPVTFSLPLPSSLLKLPNDTNDGSENELCIYRVCCGA